MEQSSRDAEDSRAQRGAAHLEIHEIVTEGTLDDPSSTGRLRRPGDRRVAVYGHENVLLHVPPPAERPPRRLERLCAFANGELDDTCVPPVVRAIVLHFMIAYDPPFEDGNGRTARAVILLGDAEWWAPAGRVLPVSRILEVAPARYARRFLYCEQDDDLTCFIPYRLDVIGRATKDLHGHLGRELKGMQEPKRSLMAVPGEFDHRRPALSERAIRDPTVRYTARSRAMGHGVVRETARQDLLDLERRGLLAKNKAGEGCVWTPHPDLPRLLREGRGRA